MFFRRSISTPSCHMSDSCLIDVLETVEKLSDIFSFQFNIYIFIYVLLFILFFFSISSVAFKLGSGRIPVSFRNQKATPPNPSGPGRVAETRHLQQLSLRSRYPLARVFSFPPPLWLFRFFFHFHLFCKNAFGGRHNSVRSMAVPLSESPPWRRITASLDPVQQTPRVRRAHNSSDPHP